MRSDNRCNRSDNRYKPFAITGFSLLTAPGGLDHGVRRWRWSRVDRQQPCGCRAPTSAVTGRFIRVPRGTNVIERAMPAPTLAAMSTAITSGQVGADRSDRLWCRPHGSSVASSTGCPTRAATPQSCAGRPGSPGDVFRAEHPGRAVGGSLAGLTEAGARTFGRN